MGSSALVDYSTRKMKYMAWIVMALLIQAILANPTPTNGVRCSQSYTLSNSNGRCEKIVTITCEDLDLRESVRNDCEEGEEADEDPEYPDYSQSISAVRCTHGYTLSNRGRCEQIVTITVTPEGPPDLCALFNFGC